MKNRDALKLPLERSWKDMLSVYQSRIGLLVLMMVCFIVLPIISVAAWRVGAAAISGTVSFAIESPVLGRVAPYLFAFAGFLAVLKFVAKSIFTPSYKVMPGPKRKGFNRARPEKADAKSAVRLFRFLNSLGVLWTKRVRQDIWEPTVNDFLVAYLESPAKDSHSLTQTAILARGILLALQTAFLVSLDLPVSVFRKFRSR